jgi:hypothetical protein
MAFAAILSLFVAGAFAAPSSAASVNGETVTLYDFTVVRQRVGERDDWRVKTAEFTWNPEKVRCFANITEIPSVMQPCSDNAYSFSLSQQIYYARFKVHLEHKLSDG